MDQPTPATGAQQPETEEQHRRYCDRILKAQEEFFQANPMGPDLIDVQADAAMAVADEEQRELRAELADARRDASYFAEWADGNGRNLNTALTANARLRAELAQARTAGQDTTVPAVGEQETRQQIAEALHKAGAYCGECNFEDDSATCPDCVRIRGWYVDAVLPVVQAAVAAGVRRALEDAREQLLFDAGLRAAEEQGDLAEYGRELAELVAGAAHMPLWRPRAHEHAYRDAVNAPLADSTIKAINERLEAGDAPRRKVASPAREEQPASVSPTAALLATSCDACRHTLNQHTNYAGCTVPLCACGHFQAPA